MAIANSTPDVRARATRGWLRAEGGAVLVLSLLLYAEAGRGWLFFLLLLFLPDLSIAGYALGVRAGATMYNLVHSYLLPLLFGAAGLLLGEELLVTLALIWTAHVGMDRLLGYGLKEPTGFRDTHLGPIGRSG